MHEITTEAELRELLGDPAPAALAKERSRLHELDRAWLAASGFCLVATSGADGSCDVSPKGDPAGSTLVLDDRTIAVPERAGRSCARSCGTPPPGGRTTSSPRARIAHRLERRGERLEDIERYYGEQYSTGLYPTVP